jgi:hypothetical protein
MIWACFSKKLSRKDFSSMVRPSRSASRWKASMMPFSQSIRVP